MISSLPEGGCKTLVSRDFRGEGLRRPGRRTSAEVLHLADLRPASAEVAVLFDQAAVTPARAKPARLSRDKPERPSRCESKSRRRSKAYQIRGERKA